MSPTTYSNYQLTSPMGRSSASGSPAGRSTPLRVPPTYRATPSPQYNYTRSASSAARWRDEQGILASDHDDDARKTDVKTSLSNSYYYGMDADPKESSSYSLRKK